MFFLGDICIRKFSRRFSCSLYPSEEFPTVNNRINSSSIVIIEHVSSSSDPPLDSEEHTMHHVSVSYWDISIFCGHDPCLVFACFVHLFRVQV